MKSLKMATAAALLVTAFPAVAADVPSTPEIGTEASVPWLHRRPLRDFRMDPKSDEGLYVQDTSRNWYYARLIGPCPALHGAYAIGVDTRRTDRLDRHSEFLVRDDRCGIESFTHSAPPPGRESASR
jgi:hypothetical protein